MSWSFVFRDGNEKKREVTWCDNVTKTQHRSRVVHFLTSDHHHRLRVTAGVRVPLRPWADAHGLCSPKQVVPVCELPSDHHHGQTPMACAHPSGWCRCESSLQTTTMGRRPWFVLTQVGGAGVRVPFRPPPWTFISHHTLVIPQSNRWHPLFRSQY
jgi:hypothetical protein